MIAEGVDVFRVKTPRALIGKTIEEASIREMCGCHVIGVNIGGTIRMNPSLEMTLPADGELILIGTVESEEKFFRIYRPESA
jgi:K+/H+ antiporter YhaU regulatory subunit KhtT